MAIPDTIHKQCLQTVAFAMRQAKGRDITSAEIRSAMADLDNIDNIFSWSSNISSSYRISDGMERDFLTWRNMGNRGKLDEWVDSSRWTANAIVGRNVPANGYVYYEETSLPQFKGAFAEMARDIKENARDPLVKRVYGRVAAGSGDKWSPADVIAIKSGKTTMMENQMSQFASGRIGEPRFKAFQKKNEKLASTLTNSGKKQLHIVEDMNKLYYYNRFINQNYRKNNCIPISLKKVEQSGQLRAVTTPNVHIEDFDHDEVKGIEDALSLEIEIERIGWEQTAQKAYVYFSVSGVSGYKLDIRSGQRPIVDVQISIMKEGSAAAHGKATLSIYSLITILSKGSPVIRAQNREKKRIFGQALNATRSYGSRQRRYGQPGDPGLRRLFGKRIHDFTQKEIFKDYSTKPTGTISKESLIMTDNPEESHYIKWCQYISWLSGNSHHVDNLTTEFNRMAGRGPNYDYHKAAKYLNNKVQSYEAAQVVDLEQNHIGETIKENIMKAVYSQGASKGFRIFADDKITDYMTASSYLKVGG